MMEPLDPDSWTEIADPRNDVLLRRIVVGPLSTNCFLVGSRKTKLGVLVDPGAEAAKILDAVSDMKVATIVLTHAHFDHVEALAEVADALGAPIAAHPADAPVWPNELRHLRTHGHFDAGSATADLLAAGCSLCPQPGAVEWDGRVDRLLRGGETVVVGESSLRVVHTPGHTPGGLSLVVGDHVLTGDTLFPGGPGLTGWPMSDFSTIISSVRNRLFALPDATLVHPGHGRSTDIGSQRPLLAEWIERGW
jgi:hydroxyacylglutathione hydrolase